MKSLLELPIVYRLWQAPFAADKIKPVFEHASPPPGARVLDLGCGPGTNAHLFTHCDYTGIDLEPEYISYAQGKFAGKFIVADASTYAESGPGFDFILINSLLHHLDDQQVQRLLSNVRKMLAPEGRVHMLELVKVSPFSPAGVLVLLDRGKFARTSARWMELFGAEFECEHSRDYQLKFLSVPLWNMIYCRGLSKRGER